MPSSNDNFSGGIELPAICNFEIISKSTKVCMFIGEINKLINCVETNEAIEHVPSEIEGVIILDARKRVELKDAELSVFGPMKLMFGSHAFNIAISKNQNLLCIAILSGNSLDRENTPQQMPLGTRQFGTLTERLELGANWIEVIIVSEPFITVTAFGYAPALLIRTAGNKEKHILEGAKSLSKELEKYRHPRTGLIDLKVRIRKAGVLKTDPYQVELVSRPE